MAGRRKTGAHGLVDRIPRVGGDVVFERQPRRQPEHGSDGASSKVQAGEDAEVPTASNPPELEQLTSRGVLSQDTRTISFGGSGAKFTPLRNRRGVRAGQDGLIQKRLNLTVVNGGDGKFSLSLGKKRKVI